MLMSWEKNSAIQNSERDRWELSRSFLRKRWTLWSCWLPVGENRFAISLWRSSFRDWSWWWHHWFLWWQISFKNYPISFRVLLLIRNRVMLQSRLVSKLWRIKKSKCYSSHQKDFLWKISASSEEKFPWYALMKFIVLVSGPITSDQPISCCMKWLKKNLEANAE